MNTSFQEKQMAVHSKCLLCSPSSSTIPHSPPPSSPCPFSYSYHLIHSLFCQVRITSEIHAQTQLLLPKYYIQSIPSLLNPNPHTHIHPPSCLSPLFMHPSRLLHNYNLRRHGPFLLVHLTQMPPQQQDIFTKVLLKVYTVFTGIFHQRDVQGV